MQNSPADRHTGKTDSLWAYKHIVWEPLSLKGQSFSPIRDYQCLDTWWWHVHCSYLCNLRLSKPPGFCFGLTIVTALFCLFCFAFYFPTDLFSFPTSIKFMTIFCLIVQSTLPCFLVSEFMLAFRCHGELPLFLLSDWEFPLFLLSDWKFPLSLLSHWKWKFPLSLLSPREFSLFWFFLSLTFSGVCLSHWKCPLLLLSHLVSIVFIVSLRAPTVFAIHVWVCTVASLRVSAVFLFTVFPVSLRVFTVFPVSLGVHCLFCLMQCSLSFLSHSVFTVFSVSLSVHCLSCPVFTVFPVSLSIHCLSCLRVFTDFPVSFRAFTVSLRVFTVFPVSLSVHCLSCFSCLSLSLLLCNHKFYLYCVCLCVKSSKHSTV